MNMKLKLIVPIVCLLLQLVTSQNATETDDDKDDSMTDDFSGPPPGDRPPGPPPGDRPPGPPPGEHGGHWRHHGRPPFDGKGPCGPHPPFPTESNETNADENGKSKRSVRQRRDPPQMNDENMGVMMGHGPENGNQTGPPLEIGGGGRLPPRGFVEKRAARARREQPNMNDEGGMNEGMSQGPENGSQGGPPHEGGRGGRGPPREFVKKRSVRKRRDSSSMDEDDMSGMDEGMMGHGPKNGNMDGPPRDGGDGERGPPRGGRMRRCGRRFRYRTTTPSDAEATTAATTAASG